MHGGLEIPMSFSFHKFKITVALLILIAPAIVCAGNTPDWEISYAYESNGSFIPIENGGTYDIPLGVPVLTAHTFPTTTTYGWATVYKGVPGSSEIMNHYGISNIGDPDLLENSLFRYGEGDYFLVIYDATQLSNPFDFYQIINQFTSSSTGVYPPSWGLIQFKIGKKPTCCSNVLFIPGFQGSRLYERQGGGSETLLWPPSSIQNSVYRLYLNEQGDSINDIYTKEDGVISQVVTPFGSYDVYTGLLAMLGSLTSGSSIQTFQTFPYDWRMDALDIIDQGTPYSNGRKFPIPIIENLAATSQTGKVTLIGHSYGGVIAKAIAYRLSEMNKAYLVDSVIMVGSPQLGTPKAAASLLHGDFQSFPSWSGFIMSKANARGVSENMKGAFNLLPSAAYFDVVVDPVINTVKAPGAEEEGGAGDSQVNTANEFMRFMTGAGGRVDPPYLSTNQPNVLSSTLLSGVSAGSHTLGSWNPASTSIKFVQIAGTGLDTPKNIVYEEEGRTFCSKLTLQCTHATSTRHSVEMTTDGDGAVVLPSAMAMTGKALYSLSIDDAIKGSKLELEHSNLLESSSILELLVKLISTTTLSSLPAFISTSTTPTVGLNRLRLRMFSPVDIHVFDEKSRHTGKRPTVLDPEFYYLEQDIPGSYYEEIGEVKHVGLLDSERYRIYLVGTGEGVFTFEIESVRGYSSAINIRYSDLPVTASTTAYMDVFPNGTLGGLQIDVEGDGVVDDSLVQGSHLSIQALLQMLVAKTKVSVSDPKDMKHLTHDIDKIKKAALEKPQVKYAQDVLKQCEKLKKSIRALYKQGGIAEADAERMLELLDMIEVQLT